MYIYIIYIIHNIYIYIIYIYIYHHYHYDSRQSTDNLTQADDQLSPWRHHPWHPGAQATPNWSRPLPRSGETTWCQPTTGGKKTENPDVWIFGSVCVCVIFLDKIETMVSILPWMQRVLEALPDRSGYDAARAIPVWLILYLRLFSTMLCHVIYDAGNHITSHQIIISRIPINKYIYIYIHTYHILHHI